MRIDVRVPLTSRRVQACRYLDGDWWVRVFGYGVSVKHEARVYSDRNLCGAVRWIGPWLVRLLSPAPST